MFWTIFFAILAAKAVAFGGQLMLADWADHH
jgi:hypothetical protein